MSENLPNSVTEASSDIILSAPSTSPSSGSSSVILSSSGPHGLECYIQRELQSNARLKFSRLTVHKCPQGVCLEGLLESNEDGLDLCELVNEIAGVNAINRVVMSQGK